MRLKKGRGGKSKTVERGKSLTVIESKSGAPPKPLGLALKMRGYPLPMGQIVDVA